MRTPDLAIIAQEGPTAKDAFLDKVRQLQRVLAPGGPVDAKGKLDNDRNVFGTTDADLENEFGIIGDPVYSDHAMDAADGTGGIEYFLQQVKSFYDQLQADLGVPPAKDGRLPNLLQPMNDPIRGSTHAVDGIYSWQDTRGVHTITVEIGPFIKARVEDFKPNGIAKLWGKSGFRLKDYCDNSPGCPYNGPDRTWVRIKREDPSEQVGWWKWNPFGNKITKAARVSYDRLFVKLCGTSGNECP